MLLMSWSCYQKEILDEVRKLPLTESAMDNIANVLVPDKGGNEDGDE